MKVRILISAILLIFAGSFVSCENKEEVNCYLYPCQCKEEWIWTEHIHPILSREVWLFKDRIPCEFREKEKDLDAFIIYHSETNRVSLWLWLPYQNSYTLGEGLICNLPDFAKEWLSYENGIRVCFEGVMYHCMLGGYTATTQFCFVLTRIERRQL